MLISIIEPMVAEGIGNEVQASKVEDLGWARVRTNGSSHVEAMTNSTLTKCTLRARWRCW